MVEGAIDTVVCSYCLKAKPKAEMSIEHIWPQSLGGDRLGWPWRTQKVCVRCNGLAGQFIDAAFVKSMIGLFERAHGTEEYLDPAHPEKALTPYVYMGPAGHEELRADEVADIWIGAAGSSVIHIRPKHDDIWDTYAGGKPTRKRSEGGHAYLAFRSGEPFWAAAAFWSFQKQFKTAKRTLLNADMPEVAPKLTSLDPEDAEQVRHVRIARSFDSGATGQAVISLDLGNRLLVKVALGLGRETLGEAFLDSSYAVHLSQSLWERDPEKRALIPVRGSGFIKSGANPLEQLPLGWSGGWVLLLMLIGGRPSLSIISPSGKFSTILVSDQVIEDGKHPHWFLDGEMFLVIPTIETVAGPIPFPDYLAFMLGELDHPELARLKKLRRDPGTFPNKR